ncbi:MAG: acyl carrier protein [Deltaproteobacteria bacterium]|nr:acyl carrier protein [Deltaproteobacteria bacterium]
MKDIVPEIKQFLIDQRLVKGNSDIGEEDSLLEGEIIDSLGILELTVFIEARYGIKVDAHDLVPENFDSLAAIKNYVTSKTA